MPGKKSKTKKKDARKSPAPLKCRACRLDRIKCHGNGKTACPHCTSTSQLCAYVSEGEYFNLLRKLIQLRDAIMDAGVVALAMLPLFGSLLPVLGFDKILVVKESLYDHDENFENPRRRSKGKKVFFPEVALAMDENPAVGVTVKARTKIPRGAWITEYGGEYFDSFEEIPEEDHSHTLTCFQLFGPWLVSSVKKNFTWAYYITRHQLGGFINDHSGTDLKPNAEYVNINCPNGYRPPYPWASGRHCRVWIRATRLIFPGEKIIVRYGPSYDDFVDMTSEPAQDSDDEIASPRMAPRLRPLGICRDRSIRAQLVARGHSVEGVLGQGGYGKQLKTFKDGEYFAVKVPVQADRKLAASIKREGEMLKNLQHPNVISACELIISTTTAVYFITKYYVNHIIFEDRTMAVIPSRTLVRSYMLSLLRGLEYLHGQGIAHRDIKIDNFLFDCNAMHGVIVDFGMATRAIGDGAVGVDEEDFPVRNLGKRKAAADKVQAADVAGATGNIVTIRWRGGTQGYQAPETIIAGAEEQEYHSSSAVDIWAAGIILIQLVTQVWCPFLPRAISQGQEAMYDTLEQLADTPILLSLHQLRDKHRSKFPRSVRLPAGNGEPPSAIWWRSYCLSRIDTLGSGRTGTIVSGLNAFFQAHPPAVDPVFNLLNALLQGLPSDRAAATTALAADFFSLS